MALLTGSRNRLAYAIISLRYDFCYHPGTELSDAYLLRLPETTVQNIAIVSALNWKTSLLRRSPFYLIAPAHLGAIQSFISRLDHLIWSGLAFIPFGDTDTDRYREFFIGRTVSTRLF